MCDYDSLMSDCEDLIDESKDRDKLLRVVQDLKHRLVDEKYDSKLVDDEWLRMHMKWTGNTSYIRNNIQVIMPYEMHPGRIFVNGNVIYRGILQRKTVRSILELCNV